MRVALSIGHSAKDCGAVAYHDGSRYEEYDLNKALFDEVSRLRLKNGHTWWQSDADCDDLPYPDHLVQTVKNINASDAVCCVELHHNSVANHKVKGGMAIYWDTSVWGKRLSDYIALHMNFIRFNFDGFREYWKSIQKNYYQAGSVATLKHIKRRLYYLGETHVPACIVEPGFISNYADLRICLDRRTQIAMAIRDGVDMFLSQLTGDD
jgi:N-acetylmuramoyl-L-alanine amidase